MITSRYKIEIDKKNKKILRKLFFQKQDILLILNKTNLTIGVFYRIIHDNGWMKKRERYWAYIIKWGYRNCKTMGEVCSMSGISSYNILSRIKRKYNIKTIRIKPPWNKKNTDKIEKNMVKDYKNLMSSNEIAKKYNFKTSKTVLDVLRKKDIKRRDPVKITYYNKDYFKKINSNDKAYILALFLTDGYVIRDYRGVAIQLKEEDGYILERIAKRLGKSTTIIHIDCSKKREKARKDGDKRFINSSDMKRLSCYCPDISIDMKKLGVVRNKTFKIKCPKIPKKYWPSFFRGLFDGDGTIGVAKTGNIWCKLVSASKDFIYGLYKLDILFDIKICDPVPSCNLYKFRIKGGNKETIKFLRWIYKDKGDMYLRRKYEKVQNKIS